MRKTTFSVSYLQAFYFAPLIHIAWLLVFYLFNILFSCFVIYTINKSNELPYCKSKNLDAGLSSNFSKRQIKLWAGGLFSDVRF